MFNLITYESTYIATLIHLKLQIMILIGTYIDHIKWWLYSREVWPNFKVLREAQGLGFPKIGLKTKIAFLICNIISWFVHIIFCCGLFLGATHFFKVFIALFSYGNPPSSTSSDRWSTKNSTQLFEKLSNWRNSCFWPQGTSRTIDAPSKTCSCLAVVERKREAFRWYIRLVWH